MVSSRGAWTAHWIAARGCCDAFLESTTDPALLVCADDRLCYTTSASARARTPLAKGRGDWSVGVRSVAMRRVKLVFFLKPDLGLDDDANRCNKMAETAPFYFVFAKYAYFNNLLLSLHILTSYG